MNTNESEKRRVLSELLETARDLNANGLISKTELTSIKALCEVPPEYTADRVQLIRTSKAQMSQSVFAVVLNVSVSTVQKWEAADSGKHPSGAAAKLLQIIEQRGIEALYV